MNGRPWTKRELAILRRMYPDAYGKDIARQLGRSRTSVYGKAGQLGLTKSAAFYARQHIDEGTRLQRAGCAHRFPKGHVPANKGLRRPGWHRGRMRETQFKKGQWPINKDPGFYVIGALRVNADGYIDMRISFDPGARGWRGLHLILWEDVHGAIPPGHCLIFRNGDKLDVELDNLELITRAENMRRNSIHNLPAPLKSAIQVLGQLRRRVNERRGKQSRGQDSRGPARPSVRNAARST